MTIAGKLITFFPLLHFLLVFDSALTLCRLPGLGSLLWLLFWIYAFPVIAYKIHNRFFPIEEGTSSIIGEYSPWYGGHMIQSLFVYFPALERVIRLVPGLFSVWLRLWGSSIGRDVSWTPHFELEDRAFMDVGNNAVFEHGVKESFHLISPSREDILKLVIKKIKIGEGAFVGGATVMAPGVEIEPGAFVEEGTYLCPDDLVTK